MSYTTTGKCYHSHQPLYVGGDKYISGGSCVDPKKGFDIYVSLDFYAKALPQRFPWNKGEVIVFNITDMKPPTTVRDFKQMIKYLSEQLDQGKSVHVGCLGGHGRTGIILAALIAYRKWDTNPIQYVRNNYCHKAVESHEQIQYLHKHFGCPIVKPSKLPRPNLKIIN